MPTDSLFESFSKPEVRDLVWVIKSPGLLNTAGSTGREVNAEIIDDSWCDQQVQKHWQWLRALDENPQSLLDWLKPRYNPRLGYYFESLVEYWLRHAFADQLLVPHLQVKNEQRTLGEFDYLLADSSKRMVHHWEVAVKFYLHYRQSDGRVLWYGPNPRDRLDLKLQRLFNHQLVLSLRPEALAALRQAGLIGPVLPFLFLKGYLFYPSTSDWLASPPFPELSSHHLRGWWTYLEPFAIPNSSDSDRRWMFLPRLQWLAPAVSRESQNGLMDFKQLHSFCLDLLGNNQKPPLIAEMCVSETGGWHEVSRGFVVPQRWPGKHAK